MLKTGVLYPQYCLVGFGLYFKGNGGIYKVWGEIVECWCM